jgi:cellulose biosynthesis protein BcsQ
VAQLAATEHGAALIVADVGPNLGAINRSALIASDFVAVPLAADLFSLQGLRNLGPTLRRWRAEWRERRANWSEPQFDLPEGGMKPIGYLVQQHSVRLDRPVQAYERWAVRIPSQYRESVLDTPSGDAPTNPADDPECLATLKHYRSLVPMAQEARKPIFELTAADGALGSHAVSVQNARKDFDRLAGMIRDRLGLPVPN